eukprot:6370011-Prymnesium_polylepis.1
MSAPALKGSSAPDSLNGPRMHLRLRGRESATATRLVVIFRDRARNATCCAHCSDGGAHEP